MHRFTDLSWKRDETLLKNAPTATAWIGLWGKVSAETNTWLELHHENVQNFSQEDLRWSQPQDKVSYYYVTHYEK